MKNYVAQNIKYLCEKNYLTQSQFGEIFKLKQSLVNAYVNEKALPKVDTMILVCEHFGVDLGDFISRPLSEVNNEGSAKFRIGQRLNEEDIQNIVNLLIDNEDSFLANRTFSLYLDKKTSKEVKEELRRLINGG